MNPKVLHITILLLAISALHLIGVFAGLYDEHVPIDIPQHILAGVMFGVVWLWFLKPKGQVNLSGLFIFTSILGFVALLGLAWEVFEFTIWNSFPTFANNFKLYSSTVGELLKDMTANFVGGLLVYFYTIRKEGA